MSSDLSLERVYYDQNGNETAAPVNPVASTNKPQRPVNPYALPEEKPAPVKPTPGWLDSTVATLNQENWVSSAVADERKDWTRLWSGPNQRDRLDPNFDPEEAFLAHPDLEAYREDLFKSRNKEQFDNTVAWARRQISEKQIVDDNKGFWNNVVPVGLSIIGDPTNYIPFGGVVKTGKAVTTIAKSAVNVGVAGAAIGGVQGALLDSTQHNEESKAVDHALYGAVGGTILGGAVGAYVSKDLAKKAVAEAIDYFRPKPSAQAPTTLPTTGNAGAAKVAPVVEDGMRLPRIETAAKLHDNGITGTPNIKLATSPSEVARRAGQKMGNNAFQTAENLEGVASTQSFELGFKQKSQVLTGGLLRELDESFKSFHTNINKLDFVAMADELKNVGRNVTPDELAKDFSGTFYRGKSKQLFNDLVSAAGSNGDVSAIPEVRRAALAARKVTNELGQAANDAGLLEKVHAQAERDARRIAMESSPAKQNLIAQTTEHFNQKLAAQATQLVRRKDMLFALKSSGNASAKNIAKYEAAVARMEKQVLAKNGGEQAIRDAHAEFAAVVKGATADVTDTTVRQAVAKKLFDDKRLSVAAANKLKLDARQGLTNFAEQAAKDARANSEALQPKTAISYRPGKYDAEKIMDNPIEFKNDIRNYYLSKGMSAEDAEIAALDWFDTLDKAGGKKADIGPSVVGGASALKSRTRDIPDNVMAKWMINDPEFTMRKYIGEMTRELEFNRVFNGQKIDDITNDIATDYQKMIDEADSMGKKDVVRKLNAEKNSDLAQIKYMYEKLMGKANEVDNWARSSSNALKKITNFNSLGNIVMASLPDVGRLTAADGFGSAAKAVLNIATGKEFRNLAREEAEQIGWAFESAIGSRANALADLDSNVLKLRPNLAEKGLDYLNSKFHKITLFDKWNSSMKHMAGIIQSDKAMRAAIDYGNADVATKAYLAQAGIDEGMASRIADQFAKYGVEEKSFKFANVGIWDDPQAQDTYRRAIFKLVNHTIMTPDVGTVPKYFTGPTGSLLMQFMSFASATEEQMILSGVQKPVANEIKGIIIMMMMATGKEYFLDNFVGKGEKEPTEILIRGLLSTGVLGWPEVINGRLHNVGLGVQDMFDDETEKRVDGWKTLGLVAGPTISKSFQAVSGLINIWHGNENEKDVADIIKMIPFNNHLAIKKAGEMYKESNGQYISNDIHDGVVDLFQ